MQKEIHEQPKTLADTMRGRLVVNKPLKPVKSNAAEVIFSGANIPPCVSSSLFAHDDTDAFDDSSFDLPGRRAVVRTAGGASAKAQAPAGKGLLTTLPAAPAPAATNGGRLLIGGNGADCLLDCDDDDEPFIRLGGLSDHVEGILRCRRIVFVACGTSYHACLVARKTLEEFANMPVVVELAGDFMVGAGSFLHRSERGRGPGRGRVEWLSQARAGCDDGRSARDNPLPPSPPPQNETPPINPHRTARPPCSATTPASS
jgi:hypothetical protein